ncbi:3-deoxy-D-manno-octulosonic acid transferase [Ruegeria sp. 2012CJ41-6]|uniref:3-deoxy-D-manno-octulosonic acid transferase n=1 Tax=Ruegeria spongiae TaxID=2942209 RepID=A0ABT0Q5E5_9RHOB|nr:glycosyltransferase N-terminal domain-containing protein [Ruegeria spongiae]MCL6284657.1 3-deoxy-D-manno-octulosonic acid transferase [Ruegeria spongiae]
MARSLSLAAYRVLSWRGGPVPEGELPPRPRGELLWVHVTTRNRFTVLAEMCRRLLAQRPELHVLFTAPTENEIRAWGGVGANMIALPSDQPTAARAFLDHWQPDMCLWAGGGLQPNLISSAATRQVALVLLDVNEAELTLRKHQWMPDLMRTTLECFESILASGERAARDIRRLGVVGSKVSVSAELRASPNPTPWPEEELVKTTQLLAGRPVWLSAWTQKSEFPYVETAHRNALRLLHRLLLVLHVANPKESQALRTQLEAAGLRCADWDAGDEIEDNIQVVLTAEPDDLGLWYRIAPLTFMGSSLVSGAGGRDPLTAVALGSAVLHGPNIGTQRSSYVRLAAAGAAQSVKDATALADGIVRLLSPDHAAEMALAGWQVVTEGAQLTDQLIDLIQDKLDESRPDHARA